MNSSDSFTLAEHSHISPVLTRPSALFQGGCFLVSEHENPFPGVFIYNDLHSFPLLNLCRLDFYNG
ncbi:hypothetical protein ACQP3L_37035, partial [Escherichia coli]